MEPRHEHFGGAHVLARKSSSPKASSGGGSPSPRKDRDGDEEDSDNDARQLDYKDTKPRKPHLQVRSRKMMPLSPIDIEGAHVRSQTLNARDAGSVPSYLS